MEIIENQENQCKIHEIHGKLHSPYMHVISILFFFVCVWEILRQAHFRFRGDFFVSLFVRHIWQTAGREFL